jgi:hypothetical protein
MLYSPYLIPTYLKIYIRETLLFIFEKRGVEEGRNAAPNNMLYQGDSIQILNARDVMCNSCSTTNTASFNYAFQSDLMQLCTEEEVITTIGA